MQPNKLQPKLAEYDMIHSARAERREDAREMLTSPSPHIPPKKEGYYKISSFLS